MNDVICWEAKTRGSTIAVVHPGAPAPPGMDPNIRVRLDVGDNRYVTPSDARQLAHTLLAAADVAEEEEASRG